MQILFQIYDDHCDVKNLAARRFLLSSTKYVTITAFPPMNMVSKITLYIKRNFSVLTVIVNLRIDGASGILYND